MFYIPHNPFSLKKKQHPALNKKNNKIGIMFSCLFEPVEVICGFFYEFRYRSVMLKHDTSQFRFRPLFNKLL